MQGIVKSLELLERCIYKTIPYYRIFSFPDSTLVVPLDLKIYHEPSKYMGLYALVKPGSNYVPSSSYTVLYLLNRLNYIIHLFLCLNYNHNFNLSTIKLFQD